MGYEFRWFEPAPQAAASLHAAAGRLRKDIYFPATDSVGLKLRNGKGELELKTCRSRSASSLCDGAIELWTKTYVKSKGVYSGGRIVDSELLSARIEACAKGVWVDWDEQRGPPLTVHVTKQRTNTAFGEQELEEATLLLQATRCDTLEVVLEEAWRSVAVEVGSAQAIAATVESLPNLQPPAGAVVGGYPRMVALFARCALERLAAQRAPSDDDVVPGEEEARACVCYTCLRLVVLEMDAAAAGLSRAEPSSDSESEDACDSCAPATPLQSALLPCATLPSLIFLDIDGVLNTHSLASSDDDAYRWHHIDAALDLKVSRMDLVLSRSRVRALCSLARAHRCQIVLSTSWRVEPVACQALRAAFADHGLAETVIIGSTPELRRSTRAREIQAWLDANGVPRQAGRWIAIDDIDLARDEPELMSGHFVRTQIGAGLTEARVAEADALLQAL